MSLWLHQLLVALLGRQLRLPDGYWLLIDGAEKDPPEAVDPGPLWWSEQTRVRLTVRVAKGSGPAVPGMYGDALQVLAAAAAERDWLWGAVLDTLAARTPQALATLADLITERLSASGDRPPLADVLRAARAVAHLAGRIGSVTADECNTEVSDLVRAAWGLRRLVERFDGRGPAGG